MFLSASTSAWAFLDSCNDIILLCNLVYFVSHCFAFSSLFEWHPFDLQDLHELRPGLLQSLEVP